MEWIKLADKLPDPGRMVLALGFLYDTGGGFYFYEVARIRPSSSSSAMIRHPIYGRYVWWMNLPQHPEDFYRVQEEVMNEHTTPTTWNP